MRFIFKIKKGLKLRRLYVEFNQFRNEIQSLKSFYTEGVHLPIIKKHKVV